MATTTSPATENVIAAASAEFGDAAVRADRRGANVLILFDDGDCWRVLYRWLTHADADLAEVLGQERTRWEPTEIDPMRDLFEQIQLFP